jgi:hypothetical protein
MPKSLSEGNENVDDSSLIPLAVLWYKNLLLLNTWLKLHLIERYSLQTVTYPSVYTNAHNLDFKNVTNRKCVFVNK